MGSVGEGRGGEVADEKEHERPKAQARLVRLASGGGARGAREALRPLTLTHTL
jgi:hypothetical protein